MAVKDKKAVIRSLIESGKANGKLTTREINDALEQLDFDVEKVDKLYDTLESLNITRLRVHWTSRPQSKESSCNAHPNCADKARSMVFPCS